MASAAETLLARLRTFLPAPAAHGLHLGLSLVLLAGAKVVTHAILVFVSEARRIGIFPLFFAADIADTVFVLICETVLFRPLGSAFIPAAEPPTIGNSRCGSLVEAAAVRGYVAVLPVDRSSGSLVKATAIGGYWSGLFFDLLSRGLVPAVAILPAIGNRLCSLRFIRGGNSCFGS